MKLVLERLVRLTFLVVTTAGLASLIQRIWHDRCELEEIRLDDPNCPQVVGMDAP